MKPKRMKKIITLIITICMVISTGIVSTVEVEAASKVSNPKITRVASDTSSVTLNWNRVKGAKKYQIALVSYKWKKYKKVAKTVANKKKFSKAGKYKVVVSGKKYQVYRVSKTYYKNKRTVVKNSYKWNKLKSNTTYTFAIRAINGKRTSKWVVRRIATKKVVKNSSTNTGKNTSTNKENTVSNNNTVNNNNSENNTHKHEYTRPANKNPLEELLKGKCHEVCATCGAERILYAKWVKTEDAQEAWSQDICKNIACSRIECHDPYCMYDYPGHKKAKKENEYIISGETIHYIYDVGDDRYKPDLEELINELNYALEYSTHLKMSGMINIVGWSETPLRSFNTYKNALDYRDNHLLDRDIKADYPDLYYTMNNSDVYEEVMAAYNMLKPYFNMTYEEYCQEKGRDYPYPGTSEYEKEDMAFDIMADIANFSCHTFAYQHDGQQVANWWHTAYTDVYDYTIDYPATLEKGYWDFSKGSYIASNVGWSSTLLNNKELAYGYNTGSYIF